MTTTFNNALAKRTFKLNTVIKLNSTTYFSQHAVDSGLSMDSNKIGLITNVNVSAASINLKTVKTSIPTITFSLLDKDGVISDLIMADKNAWCEYQVDFYMGFNTTSFHWDNYKLIATGFIKSWDKIENGYNFTAVPAVDQLITDSIYNTYTHLDGDLAIDAVAIDLVDADDIPSASGTDYLLKIGSEFVTWTGKTANQLTGVTRAALSSTASSHYDGDKTSLVTKLTDNAMDMLLDILINQIGISSALVDSDTFEALRDDEFSTDGDFILYAYDVTNALTFIENNLLVATNTRLISKNVDNVFKISIALLDQVDFATDANSITESHTVGTPSYRVNVNDIVNNLNLAYDFTEGTKTYATTRNFQDTNSISRFGTKTYTINLKGIHTENNGYDMITSRGNRLLQRLSTPSVEVIAKTFLNRFNIDIGDRIYLEHSNLPQSGGGETFDNMLEVLSKSVTGFTDEALITFKLAFTSYAGLRYGLISPSGLITSVISQKIFEMEQAQVDQMKVGYRIRLWNVAGEDYYSDTYRTITEISNNQITVDTAFDTTLTTAIRVQFPDYNDATAAQQIRFAFISDATNEFDDGIKAYEIIN